MGLGFVGTQTLSNKLTKILYTHIKVNLPDIAKEITERITEVSDRINELGTPLPEEPNEKLQMAWGMVMDFCTRFKDAIAGKTLSRKDRKDVICPINSIRKKSLSKVVLSLRKCTSAYIRSMQIKTTKLLLSTKMISSAEQFYLMKVIACQDFHQLTFSLL